MGREEREIKMGHIYCLIFYFFLLCTGYPLHVTTKTNSLEQSLLGGKFFAQDI